MKETDKIWRDENGVCHIEGDDRQDVFELMGYAHGRDRGMQMLLMRILGQGRAAELLDSSDEMVAIDTFFRRMNRGGGVAGEVEKISPETRNILQAYCRGVNRAMAEKIPWELRVLGYRPEEWCAGDSVMIADLAEDAICTNPAGGPSDRRFSRWYCSDLENWKARRYKSITSDPAQRKLPF